MSEEQIKSELLIETVVRCPECNHRNRLSKRATQGIYRCGNCWHDLPNPFLSPSEQPLQDFPSRDFSDRKIITISILTGLTVIGSLVAVVRSCSSEKPSSPSSVSIALPSPTASPTLSSSTPKPKPVPKSKPVPKPKPDKGPTDDYGRPFPTKSGYLKGYPALSVGGYSSVTVDNSRNGSDVFVKLFTLDTAPPKAASVFFIRARDTFTVTDVQPGNYDIRYRDLTSSGLSKTERFNLKEVRTAKGVEFSRMRLTLYKVLNGNMQIQPISENDF
jgi:DNA-directed RNA polymerase subunit RPC12/RpoP